MQSTAKRAVWTARAVWRSDEPLRHDRMPNIRGTCIYDYGTLAV